MRLRDLLKKHRIRQVDLVRALNARYQAIVIHQSGLSMVVSGVANLTNEQRKRIRSVLRNDFEVSPDEIDAVPELNAK